MKGSLKSAIIVSLIAASLFWSGRTASAIDNWSMDMILSSADASFLGEAGQYGYAGSSVAGVGDVNGDGFDDFLIGSYKAEQDESGYPSITRPGKAYLILGRPEADWGSGFSLRNHHEDDITESADAIFVGEEYDSQAGWAVAGVGDVNNDGLDDFIIGAYYDRVHGYKRGQVYLILGRAGADWGTQFSLSGADASFFGETNNYYAGWSVAGVGNVNNDCCDDFVVGGYQANSFMGEVHLILGKESGWAPDLNLSTAGVAAASFIGEADDDCAGWAVSGAGDVNNDNYDDFLIGATGDDGCDSVAGKVYLILGKDTGWAVNAGLSTADAKLAGTGDDAAGSSLAGVGDVNNDGFDDILIGAAGDSNVDPKDATCADGGRAYLVLGNNYGTDGKPDWGTAFDLSSDANATFVAGATDAVGSSIAGAGDVNLDGYADFLIGASCSNSGAGKTYLLLGNDDGDGGAPDWGANFNLSGADASLSGEDSSDYAGRSVAGAGDVNGDGYGDIIIGAWKDEAGGTNTGQAYLILSPENPNTPPAAAAGGNETNHLDSTPIALSGTCTDIDSEDTIYGWWSHDDDAETACTLSGHTEAAKTSGSNSVNVAASCTPNVPQNETLTFQLHCDDETEAADASRNVGVNAAPLANNQSIVVGEDDELSIILTGSDPDAEAIEGPEHFEVLSNPDHGSLSGTAPNLTYSPDENYFGVDSFTFRVNDGLQNSSNIASVSLSINSANDIPVADAGSNQTVEGGAVVQLDGTNSYDIDEGAALTYSWAFVTGPVETVALSNEDRSQAGFTATRAGHYTFRLVVNDGVIDSNPDSVIISVNNAAPVIHETDGGLDIECNYSEDCSLADWEITDANEDEVVSSWAQLTGTSPLTFTGDNKKVAMPNHLYKGGIYTVRQVAADGMGGITNSSTIRILMPNNLPEIDSIEVADKEDGSKRAIDNGTHFAFTDFSQDVSVTAAFSDYDDNSLTYSWSLANAASDLVAFTSVAGGEVELRFRKAGTTYIDVSADDGNGGTVSERIAIYQPIPEIGDLKLIISSYEAAGANTSDISGELESPVMPIIMINGVAAEVTFSEEDGIYRFSAHGVPLNGDPDQIEFRILTDVDGEEVLLYERLISVESMGGLSGGDGSGDGGGTGGKESGGDGAAAGSGDSGSGRGGCGCVISNAGASIPWQHVLGFLLITGLSLAIWSRRRAKALRF